MRRVRRKVRRVDHAIYKNNFWNNLRKSRGVTFKYISDILGVPPETVRLYFIGSRMPDAEQIKTLCEGFDVDIEKGTAEFKKMRKEWKSTHKTSDTNNKTSDTEASNVCKSPINIYKSPDYISNTYQDYMESLYSKISYKEFRRIESLLAEDGICDSFIPSIYGEVDFDTFYKIYKDVKVNRL